jgi:catechol 2,3-dioxygenase-like lactoylglutathione lyase family enzyme
MTDGDGWFLRAVLITVSDLDRSVKFYKDVCGAAEIMYDPDCAVLGAVETPASPVLALRPTQGRGLRGGQETLGLRACSFFVGSDAELDRIEERLKALSAFQDRQQRGKDGGIGMVRGHDPDRLPLAFMNYGLPLAEEDQRDLLPLIYGWDL